MLLDEPSMGLAPMLVAEIFEIVSRLNRDEKVAVLLAEQNATVALKYAQHGYVMETGALCWTATPAPSATTRTSRSSIWGSPASGSARATAT
jgi:branched-chain amino acid transport system ATP-binding protein